ncbi:MAG: hypothetical protein H7A47_05365 [Verrucomicrobiales bacterium]|nr:hypothetical protein [Verrucomicrobiales bacterium]
MKREAGKPVETLGARVGGAASGHGGVARHHRWRAPGAFGLIGWLLAACLPAPVLACRYNVRDLGFIDVESEGYTLHCLIPEAFGEAEREPWRQALDPVLDGANVRWDFVAAGGALRQTDATHLRTALSGPLPGLVLVSPDGFATNLCATLPGAVSPGRAAALLEEWVTSPIRRQIAGVAGRAFGVVLLFEGTDREANTAAAREIERAIEEIKRGMGALPKEIRAAPELVRLPPRDFPEEQALLWSMGLEASPTEKPRAAIFYGRARWIGPLIEMEHLVAPNLTRLFGIIGEDCECGMDLAWTRGTVLPLRWTDSLHATAAKSLGFDPDSPMVRAEALRILGRYSRSFETARARGETAAPAEPAFAMGGRPMVAAVEVDASAPPAVADPTPPGARAITRTNQPARRSPHADPGRVLLIMAMIGLIIVFGTLLVLMTAMRRWRESARPDKRGRHSREPDA